MKKTPIIAFVVILVLAAILMFGMMAARMQARGSSGSGAYPAAAGNSGGLFAMTADGAVLASDTTDLPPNTATQKAGDLNVTLALSPFPPLGSKPGTFDVTLTDQTGKPVTDATVTLDLTMPSMWMPPNSLQAQSSGSGAYRADGRFTMRGLWRIEVIIERGGQKQSVYFGVGL
jgi:hypothetical protein